MKRETISRDMILISLSITRHDNATW